MDQFNAANVALTLAGHVVYSVATSTKGDFIPTDDQKLLLDMVHLRKIHESDMIVVVGRQEDGSFYIGDSTRREMMYAAVFDKEIVFYEPNGHAHGANCEFEKRIKRAKQTDAERELLEKEREVRMSQMMGTFGLEVSPDAENPITN
jgi:hypothetical protein